MTADKIKIAVISHALVIPSFQSRWKKLAEDDRYDVHLIVPRYWEQTWFGEKVIYETESKSQDNFHIHALSTIGVSNWTRYLFLSLDMHFKKIDPDIIYIVHEEMILVHQQIYFYKSFFCPNAKIIFFSMHALGVPQEKWHQRLRWNNVKRNTDAALVHYPGCLKSLKSAGYEKPIYLQTQVGVDETIFFTSADKRKSMRSTLKFSDKFVIGYTGRLTDAKGVWELFDAFKRLVVQHPNIVLLLVGNGDLKNKIEGDAQSYNLQDRVHITGFVDQDKVPDYMNAMDIFVLGSKTTKTWIDTFPLVTVQAQACQLPVIATKSGSIPWQLANTALYFEERNSADLAEKILMLYSDGYQRDALIDRGYKRSKSLFCITGMSENFKSILNQVLSGQFIFHKDDEQYVQDKAY